MLGRKNVPASYSLPVTSDVGGCGVSVGAVIRAFFGLTCLMSPLPSFLLLRHATAATFKNGHIPRCEIGFNKATTF